MDLPELRRKKIKDFHFLAKFKFYAKNCKGLIISNLHSCIKIISKHTMARGVGFREASSDSAIRRPKNEWYKY